MQRDGGATGHENGESRMSCEEMIGRVVERMVVPMQDDSRGGKMSGVTEGSKTMRKGMKGMNQHSDIPLPHCQPCKTRSALAADP